MIFNISDISWAVGHYFNLYVGLHGPGWLYVLGITPRGDCHFEPPEHVPRTLTRAHTCTQCSRGLPGCHGAEGTRKSRGRKIKKMPKCQKNIFYIVICTYIVTNLPSWHIFPSIIFFCTCHDSWPKIAIREKVMCECVCVCVFFFCFFTIRDVMVVR